MNRIYGIVILSLLLTAPGYAEDVKNYSNCDICPGTIHYGAVQARKIIGSEGLKLILKTDRSKRVIIKVDLDGELANGTADDNDTGYEIEISSFQNAVYLRSLFDGSYIQIVTYSLNAQRSGISPDWQPAIYLQSSQTDKIRLEDTVTAAWKKMKTSHIYDWVFSGQSHMDHLDLLGNKILYSLTLVAEIQPLGTKSP